MRPPATGHQPPATVGDLGERELIARIQQQLQPAPGWMLVGIGDDAAVVEPERNRVEVLSVDALVEGIHFDRAFVPPEAIGHRALAVNLSDLAAMGASPRLALLSFALPLQLPLDEFDRMIAGLTTLAARYRVHVAGGNLTRSPGPLLLDITVVGTVKRRQALTRSGARPGDDLYVSGTIGTAGAGLQMLQARSSNTKDTMDTKEQLGTEKGLPSVSSVSRNTCVERYLYPEPRVRLGLLLGRNRAASACVDLSDGLADGVHRIAEASDVGAVIDADAVPIAPEVRAWFEARGLDAVTEAMTAGDDYELLVSVRPRDRRRLAAASGRGEPPLTRIGVCTKERAVVLRGHAAGTPWARELPNAGYDHFRKSG